MKIIDQITQKDLPTVVLEHNDVTIEHDAIPILSQAKSAPFRGHRPYIAYMCRLCAVLVWNKVLDFVLFDPK